MMSLRSLVAARSLRSLTRAYSSRPASILPAGTPITVNYLKDAQHPVALRDEEYPEWLWTIADPPKKDWAPEEKRTKEYLKFARTQDIKLKNFIKGR
ncbi:hypothetical protein H9P43_001333 [Blastocladiella emersonii ATCC 22665]|nr:hypothetical protein H9P43_001333 [Blastocladiella emersonii ATCC 22665]